VEDDKTLLPKDITNSLTDILTASLKNPGDGPLAFSNENGLMNADEDDGDWELQDSDDEKSITQKVEELAEDDQDVLEIMQGDDQDVDSIVQKIGALRLAVVNGKIPPLGLLKQANFGL
jgi:hypothetical protein